jgi:hypothetical protein
MWLARNPLVDLGQAALNLNLANRKAEIRRPFGCR